MRTYATYNPLNKPVEELPTIYGFNNGGSYGFYYAVLIAEDGHCLGSHMCTNEGYMLGDLGILEGTRPDRHETFKQHYPDGYKMDFVGHEAVEKHVALNRAFELNSLLPQEEEK